MVKSQVVVGIVAMLIGIGLLFTFSWVGTIYGVILFLIGLFLVIYRNAESEIEKIKEVKEKGVGKK